MAPGTLRLREAAEAERTVIEELLEQNGLPADDVHEEDGQFYLAFDGDRRIGIGGIERNGSDGLLRSIVIEQDERGTGYGSALCDALESRARSDGIETLYLLTTSASGFFVQRGYEEIDRGEPPASIRRTREFADLCPDSATCMRKTL